MSTSWGYLKDLKLPGEVFKSTGILRYRRVQYHDVQAWLEEIPKYSRKTKSDEELGILEEDKYIELGTELRNLQELLAACYSTPNPEFLNEYLGSMYRRHRYMLYKVFAERSDEKEKKKDNAYRLRRKEEVEHLLQSKTTPPWHKKRLAREREPELDVKAFIPTLKLLSPRIKSMLLPVAEEIIGRRSSFDRYLMERFFTSLWILRFTIMRDFTEELNTNEILWYEPTEPDMAIIEEFLPEQRDHEQFKEEMRNVWHCDKELIRQGLTKEELSFRARLRDECRKLADIAAMARLFFEETRAALRTASSHLREITFVKCVADLNIDKSLLTSEERAFPNLWLLFLQKRLFELKG